MRMRLPKSLQLLAVGLLVLGQSAMAQTQPPKRPLPIIDVHVHAMKVNPSFSVEMCPWFLKDMPGGDPNQQMRAFLNAECVAPLQPAKSDKAMQDAMVSTMERLNMTMVAFGDPVVLRNWQKAAPGRVIPGIGVSSPNDMTVQAFTSASIPAWARFRPMKTISPRRVSPGRQGRPGRPSSVMWTPWKT